MGDDGGGCRRIAGDHDGTHTQRTKLRDKSRRIGSRWIAQRDKAGQSHGLLRACCNGQHTVPFCLKFVGHRSRTGGGLHQVLDHAERSLDDSPCNAIRSHSGGARHLGFRIERHEPNELWQIACTLPGGSRANGRVHRILTTVRAGQGRQAKNLGIAETVHSLDDRHTQLVLRQRACLVDTQDVHGRGFVHGRETRGKHAQFGQRLRADGCGESERHRQCDWNG